MQCETKDAYGVFDLSHRTGMEITGMKALQNKKKNKTPNKRARRAAVDVFVFVCVWYCFQNQFSIGFSEPCTKVSFAKMLFLEHSRLLDFSSAQTPEKSNSIELLV